MPVTLSYPGVYVEELPSGVHAISGVPTSIAALVGRATRGPTNTPTTINSFSDFVRIFGGLALGYPLSYSVRDFFANGGGQAIIVRVWTGGASSSVSSASSSSLASSSSEASSSSSSESEIASSESSASSSSSAFALPPQVDGVARIDETGPGSIGLALQAANPGVWGNSVQVHVPAQGSIDQSVLTSLVYVSKSDLFDLIITDPGSGVSETIRNVSVIDGTRRVDQVLPLESQLVRAQLRADGTPQLPAAVPPQTPAPPFLQSPSNT